MLWQPRLEHWYNVNKKRGALPSPLQRASLIEVYDYWRASIRYFGSGLRVRYRNSGFTEDRVDQRSLLMKDTRSGR